MRGERKAYAIELMIAVANQGLILPENIGRRCRVVTIKGESEDKCQSLSCLLQVLDEVKQIN